MPRHIARRAVGAGRRGTTTPIDAVATGAFPFAATTLARGPLARSVRRAGIARRAIGIACTSGFADAADARVARRTRGRWLAGARTIAQSACLGGRGTATDAGAVRAVRRHVLAGALLPCNVARLTIWATGRGAAEAIHAMAACALASRRASRTVGFPLTESTDAAISIGDIAMGTGVGRAAARRAGAARNAEIARRACRGQRPTDTGDAAQATGDILLVRVGRACRDTRGAVCTLFARASAIAISTRPAGASRGSSASGRVRGARRVATRDVCAHARLARELAALATAGTGHVATNALCRTNQSGSTVAAGDTWFAGRQLVAATIVGLETGEVARAIGVRGTCIKAGRAFGVANVGATR